MKYSKISSTLTTSVNYGKLATFSATTGLTTEDIAYIKMHEEMSINQGRIEKVKFAFLSLKRKHGRLLNDEEITNEMTLLARIYGLAPASFGKLILFEPNFFQRIFLNNILKKPFGTLSYSKELSEGKKSFPCRHGKWFGFIGNKIFASGKAFLLVAETKAEKVTFRQNIAYTMDGSQRKPYVHFPERSGLMGI